MLTIRDLIRIGYIIWCEAGRSGCPDVAHP